MEDCLSVLQSAREVELEVRTLVEQVELIHKVLNLKGRTREWAEQTVEKLAALETELNNCIDDAVDRKRDAMRVLSALSGAEKAALYQYYILARDWSEIAEELYFSERQIYNIRKRAIARLCEHYAKAS